MSTKIDPSTLELFTKREAAARLKVSLRSVDRLIAAGTLPVVRIGSHPRITARALAELMTQGEQS